MATLRIEATPSANLRRYKLAIDGMVVPMRSDNKGAVAVEGVRGDGSAHVLTYTLVGPTGATLSITVLCDGNSVKQVTGIQIFPAGEPYAAGVEDFTL